MVIIYCTLCNALFTLCFVLSSSELLCISHGLVNSMYNKQQPFTGYVISKRGFVLAVNGG